MAELHSPSPVARPVRFSPPTVAAKPPYWALAALGLLAGLVLATGCRKDAAAPAAFQVNAADFLQEMKADLKSAEGKYSGKQVEVTGRVNFVGEYSEEKRTRTLGLAGDDLVGDGLYCDVAQADRAPGRFSLGQTIRVKALAGKPIGKALKLTEGEVLDLGPSQVVAVTADELGQAFSADPKAAEARYKRKTLSLRGTVSAVKPARIRTDQQDVVLRTAPGITLLCSTNFKLDPLANRLKPGDDVTLVGIVNGYTAFDKTIQFYNFEVVPK